MENTVKDKINKILIDKNVKQSAKVLYIFLLLNPQYREATNKELAEIFQVTFIQISTLISELTKKGYIQSEVFIKYHNLHREIKGL